MEEMWTNLLVTQMFAILAFLVVAGVVRPLQRYFDKLNELSVQLGYYSNILTSPGSSDSLADEAQPIIRRLSLELEVAYLNIQFRKLVIGMNQIPNEKDMIDAKGRLIRLSNSAHRGDSHQNLKDICNVIKLLKIQEIDKENGISKILDILGDDEV